MSECADWDLSASGGTEIDILQRLRAALELGSNLHHDMVLVELRKHSRDLTLTEGIVKRVVELGRGNPKARGSIAIDYQVGAESFVLLVGRDVAQCRNSLELLD